MSGLADQLPSSLAGVAVLIIDDSEDTAEALGLLLQQYGCDVRVALNGHQGLEMLKSFRAALVLLDITMPDIDGYSVCRSIRADRGDAVYIVAVTGWAKDEDRHRALTAGFDDHVAKPVPLERLIRLVERASLKRHTAPFPGTSD